MRVECVLILCLVSLLAPNLGHAIENLSILNLNMSVFLPKTGETTLQVAFALFQDSGLVAYDLCSKYLLYTGDRLTKCIIGVDQTVKNGKLDRLHYLMKAYFPTPFNDAELFPLSYVYDFPAHDLKTACIFGYPEYSALLLPLAMTNVESVHVFAAVPEQLLLSIPLEHAYELSTIFNTKLHVHFTNQVVNVMNMLSSLNLQCGIVHISKSVPLEDASLILNTFSVKHKFNAVAQDARMVWTRLWNQTDSVSFPSESFSDLVDWTLSSLWPYPSSITPLFDPMGFSARGFTMFPNSVGLLQVQIGRLRDNEVQAPECANREGKHGIILITYTIRVFADTAFGLQSALQRLGYTQVLVFNMNLASVERLQQQTRDDLLQIAIGPHDLTMFLRRYVVFQMEQLWSSIGSTEQGTRYSAVLKGAVGILTFSDRHTQALAELGYPRAYTIPIYTRTTDTVDVSSKDNDDGAGLVNAVDDESIDILFFGSCSNRRVDLINGLIRQIVEHNTRHPTNGIIFDHYCGGWNKTIYDDQLSFRVLKSKIVLNVHTAEDSVLEVHRINYLLSKGRVVVSERSRDPLLDAQYEESVYFIDSVLPRPLLQSLLDLLALPDVRQAIKGKATEKDRQIQEDVHSLDVAMREFVSSC